MNENEKKFYTDVGSSVAAITSVALTFSASLAPGVVSPPIAMGAAAAFAAVGACLKLWGPGEPKQEKDRPVSGQDDFRAAAH